MLVNIELPTQATTSNKDKLQKVSAESRQEDFFPRGIGREKFPPSPHWSTLKRV